MLTQGSVLAGGLVANRAPAIRYLVAQLKEYLGLDLSQAGAEYFTARKPFPIKKLAEIGSQEVPQKRNFWRISSRKASSSAGALCAIFSGRRLSS